MARSTSDRRAHLQLVDQHTTPAQPGWRWTADRHGHVQLRRIPRASRIPTKPTVRERLRRLLVDLYAYLTGPAAW